MNPRKPTGVWVVHAIDPKRSTNLTSVKEIVKYPLCGTADRGYGATLFARGPRFVTCKKCKVLMNAQAVLLEEGER